MLQRTRVVIIITVQPETFFRRNVWDLIGSVNHSFHYVMDKELWVRYLLHFGLDNIIQDNMVLVNFRVHESSKTGSQLGKFREETFDLFYSIAVERQLAIADRLKALAPLSKKQLFGYDNIDNDLLEEALEYFILQVALEAYAENNYCLSKKAATLVQKQSLQQTDIRELKRTLFRISVLPVRTKIFLNHIRKWVS